MMMLCRATGAGGEAVEEWPESLTVLLHQLRALARVDVLAVLAAYWRERVSLRGAWSLYYALVFVGSLQLLGQGLEWRGI